MKCLGQKQIANGVRGTIITTASAQEGVDGIAFGEFVYLCWLDKRGQNATAEIMYKWKDCSSFNKILNLIRK